MTKYRVTFFNNNLVKSTGIYTVAGFINGSIVFFLLPFFTRYMNPDEYGMISMFRTLNSFIFPFIAFYGSVGRMFYEKENINFPRYIFNAILVIFFNTLIVGAALYLLDSVVYKYTLFPSSYLWAVILFAFSTSIMKLGLVLFQVTKKPVLYGVLQISATVVNLAVAFLLVGTFNLNWKGAVLADASVLTLFAFIILLVLARRGLSPRINYTYIKDIVAYCSPLIIHLIGRSIITMSDKIFITNMVGISETGIYAAGYQIGMIIFVLSTAFNTAWMPHLYEILKRNNLKEKIIALKQIYIYILFILIGGFAMGLLAPWITKVLLGDKFLLSSKYVIWIAVGFSFNAIYLSFGNFISYAKKTHYLAIVTSIGAILNIILNYFFIQKNGAIGAAQSTTITFFVIAILTFMFSKKAINSTLTD